MEVIKQESDHMPHDELHFIVDGLKTVSGDAPDRQYWLAKVKNGQDLISGYMIAELKGDVLWTLISSEFSINHLSTENKENRSVLFDVYSRLRSKRDEFKDYDEHPEDYDFIIAGAKHERVAPFIKMDPKYAAPNKQPDGRSKFLVMKYDALLRYLMTLKTEYAIRLRRYLLDCQKAFRCNELYIEQLEKKISDDVKEDAKKETEIVMQKLADQQIAELKQRYEEECARRLESELKYQVEHNDRLNVEEKYADAQHKIANFATVFFEQEETKRIEAKPQIAYPEPNENMPQQYFMIMHVMKQTRRVGEETVFHRQLFKMMSSAKVQNRIETLKRKLFYRNIRVIAIYKATTMIDHKAALRKFLRSKGLLVKRVNGTKHIDLFTSKDTCNIDQILNEFNSIVFRNAPNADNVEVIQRVMTENKTLLSYVNQIPQLIDMVRMVMQTLNISTPDASNTDYIEAEDDDTSDEDDIETEDDADED